MGFTRFVEVGRVVLINYGPDSGKLATIIDIVDQNKCLVDGPETGVARQVIPYKRIALTDFTVKVQRNARAKTLKAAWAEVEREKMVKGKGGGLQLEDSKTKSWL